MEDVLDKDIRGRRLREIQKYQLDIQKEIRSKMVGKTYRVLIEKKGSMKGIEKWRGRTNCSRIVHIEDDRDLSWAWVDVEITQATALSCQGKIVKVIKSKLQ